MAVRRINAKIRRLNWGEVRNSLIPADGSEGVPFEVCDASLDDWRRYVESDEAALSSSMMMWCNGKIIIVKVPEAIHGRIVSRLNCAIRDATGTGENDLRSYLATYVSNLDALGKVGRLGLLEPDCSFGPDHTVVGAIKPKGLRWDEFHTLKVEIGVSQTWGRVKDHRSLEFKADAWRQYPGVEYVLCIHASPALDFCGNRLDSVVNDEFEGPRTQPMHRRRLSHSP
ncbi:unnamed protein product [Phytophthora lilii]|uniref:Unnamed protein product n=1 Tax=Phytophthora lilii TaxID=2077276 RepID=A0A9W6X448_9STRA|nr:unnamed protein product [Phytophthora lilii]